MQLYKLLLLFASILKTTISNEIPHDDEMSIDSVVSQVANEIDYFIKTEEETPALWQLLNNLALPNSLQREDWRSFTGDERSNICIICRSILKVLLAYRRQGMLANNIKSVTIKFCTLLNIATERVCTGVVTLNLPIILHIIDARPNLTECTICGVLLESEHCPLHDPEYNWSINIDKGPRKFINTTIGNNETINIVQITDIHYDPKYEPYGNSHCNEPTCCREGQNNTNVSDKVAGFWGDYNFCDTPWHSVVDALDHIKTTHQNITYIYFTGDIIDHGVWETSVDSNMRSLNSSYLQIYEIFKNIPVYPTLGNHEPHPLNQFAPITITKPEISSKWLYIMMADLWINLGWLPEATRSTILQGGYYTLSPKKGFRVVVLNNNVCYCYNWWIWYHPKDPDNQLQWLADTLLQAEKDGEFVHILAHIPPGHEHCQTTWKNEYLKIIDRFAHIIQAQFNGHTHNDELQLHYSNDESNKVRKVNNVAWNGGSITAYTELNPNYKVYIVDSKNYTVTNFENWMYNLTLANTNVNKRPPWYMSYSFKEEYDIPDLSYVSLNTWFSKLANDNHLLGRYYRNFFKNTEWLREKCDAKCMRTYMCRIIANQDFKTDCDHTLLQN